MVGGTGSPSSTAGPGPGSAPGSSLGASTSSGSSQSATAAPTPALARYYDQKLDWSQCGQNRCTKLSVPLSYAKPGGPAIQISVLDSPANGHRKGYLVVNPGGPGGSGVDYAAAADFIVSGDVHEVYDVVGFDPRGVQRSDPITCYDDAQMDTFLGADPTPDTPAEQQAAVRNAKAFAAACEKKNPALLPNVSTDDVARDMDVLRAALGQSQLDYLGKSYGTFIGSTYAGMFPKRVDKMVIDGVLPPDLTSSQVNLGQAQGFELATRAYVGDCVAKGGCPLGGSVTEGMQRIRDLLKQLDQAPIPVSNQGDVHQLTEGWGSAGIAEAMYDQSQWPTLTKAISDAFNGNGNGLMTLADQYANRTNGGHYTGNIMQVIYAVNCLDRPDSNQLSHYAQNAKTFTAKAPTWGAFLAWGSLACGFWPAKQADDKPKVITAKGSGPILVVGTTRDPATPYPWAVRVAKELANGHLLTWDGDGHTAYMRANSCLDDAVDGYLLQGTVPPDGKRC